MICKRRNIQQGRSNRLPCSPNSRTLLLLFTAHCRQVAVANLHSCVFNINEKCMNIVSLRLSRVCPRRIEIDMRSKEIRSVVRSARQCVITFAAQHMQQTTLPAYFYGCPKRI